MRSQAMRIFVLIVLTVFSFSQMKAAYAGNWTMSMKIKSELAELIESTKSHSYNNTLKSISISYPYSSLYEIETTSCKFKAKFEYLQSDPEKKISRKIKITLIKGEPQKCDNFFRLPK